MQTKAAKLLTLLDKCRATNTDVSDSVLETVIARLKDGRDRMDFGNESTWEVRTIRLQHDTLVQNLNDALVLTFDHSTGDDFEAAFSLVFGDEACIRLAGMLYALYVNDNDWKRAFTSLGFRAGLKLLTTLRDIHKDRGEPEELLQ